MTRGPRIKNIPKRTRAKMLALCHIAGVEVVQDKKHYHVWTLRYPAKGDIYIRNSAGYKHWKQAVNHLLGVRDMVIKQP